MSIPNLTLQTDKNNTSVDADRITIRQSESGLVLTADLISATGAAYNLSDCSVLFGENKDGGKMVSDDAEIVDAAAGRIKYKLNTAVYQASGEAWFEITDTANKLIDTTTNFHIEVVKQADLPVDNENYWSRAEAMLTHVQAFMQKVENDLNAQMNNDNSKLTKFIDKFQKQVDNYSAILTSYDAKYNQLASDWKNELAAIKANADAVNKQATADFKAAQDAAVKQANDAFTQKINGLQTDYQSWKTATIADFQKQIDQLSQKLSDDEKNQVNLQKAIDAANTAISKINDVDFNLYAKKADLDKINTLSKPTNVDSSVNPDSLTEPGVYFAQNGFGFAKGNIPDGYRADGKSYMAVLQGQNPGYDVNYFQQFLFQGTKFNFECWYRAGYKYSATTYYTVSFTNLKDIYGRVKQISVNEGTAVGPDDKGIVNISIPSPDLQKYVQSVNGKKPDKNGAIQLTNFENPDFKYIKGQTLDIDKFTTPGICYLMDVTLTSSINDNALAQVPGNLDGKTYTGYLVVFQHDSANITQTLMIYTGRDNPDFTISTRCIYGTSNYRPNFQRLATSLDLQNIQGQITSIAQNSMKSWSGTLAQYQALTSYDPMTMYFIVSDYEVVVK